MLEFGYLFVTFDFSGSGKSDGEYVCYGAKEVYDLDSVL
jgi:predicted acyl esterase